MGWREIDLNRRSGWLASVCTGQLLLDHYTQYREDRYDRAGQDMTWTRMVEKKCSNVDWENGNGNVSCETRTWRISWIGWSGGIDQSDNSVWRLSSWTSRTLSSKTNICRASIWASFINKISNCDSLSEIYHAIAEVAVRLRIAVNRKGDVTACSSSLFEREGWEKRNWYTAIQARRRSSIQTSR